MDYVGKIGNLFSSLNNFYNEINPATLSGAIDIIVVKQEDGDLASSPFHVRFGKLSVLLPQEKRVEIKVNGEKTPYLMKVGEAGEAFFVFETDHEVPEEFQTSPILQALVNNAKSDDEEPPFLDIGDKQASNTTSSEKDLAQDTSKQKDDFDDDEETEKIHIPAELQSPKMIIEEQMDKVVTKIDSYDTNVYPMKDGSTMLERVAPEAITTTTIAKERFIVRPLEGDIHSIFMDVTHTAIIEHNGSDGEEQKVDDEDIKKADEAIHGSGENESIVLDMAGYKTEQQQQSTKREDNVKDNELTDVNNNDQVIPIKDKNEPLLEKLDDVTDYDNNTPRNEKRSSWGWGKSDATEESGSPTTKDNPIIEIPTRNEQSAENNTVHLRSGHTYRIEMSLCGFSQFGYDKEENAQFFKEKQISYDTFVHNPSMLNDPRLVFRYNDHYFAAANNSPMFTSLLIFKKPLEDKDTLATEYGDESNSTKMSDSRDTYSYGRGWRQWLSRSSSADPLPPEEDIDDQQVPFSSTPPIDNDDEAKQVKEQVDDKKEDFTGERTTFTTTTKTTSVGWSPDHTHDDSPFFPNRKKYAKTLRLTSDQLKNLHLKKGANTITFSVQSAYQGIATCVAKVFFWDYDIQVVISDIDGTITKSDTMGHLMTMIGKDWTHEGVAQLYTHIANNGFYFMYLTSRAIGQADYTRDYLKKVSQNNYQLPDGPVIMSPDRLFTSFHREVIMRKPEMFKMACLKDIQRLFGRNNNAPFYAGFGNRITDAISYRSVNVPSSRIFTIDAQGDVKLELVTGFKSSYIHLKDLVDQIFPPIDHSVVNDEYSDYSYWKAPMPEIEIPELDGDELPMPTSPKPKPIKPDPVNSLPKESVVGFEPEPKRGILRSFTSRSTTSSNKSAISASSSKRHQIGEPPKMVASMSAPDLIAGPLNSTTGRSMESDYKNGNDNELLAPSPALSPRSLPGDYNYSASDNTTPKTSPDVVPTRSRSGIMSKVIGGVFSRKAKTIAPTQIEEEKTDEDNKDDTKHDKKVNNEEIEEEDSLFNDEIDDLDLDQIPFI